MRGRIILKKKKLCYLLRNLVHVAIYLATQIVVFSWFEQLPQPNVKLLVYNRDIVKLQRGRTQLVLVLIRKNDLKDKEKKMWIKWRMMNEWRYGKVAKWRDGWDKDKRRRKVEWRENELRNEKEKEIMVSIHCRGKLKVKCKYHSKVDILLMWIILNYYKMALERKAYCSYCQG